MSNTGKSTTQYCKIAHTPVGTCSTTSFIVEFFVPMLFDATHSYKPPSVGLKFRMERLSPFTSVFATGKGLPNLFQLILGGGNPSA